MGYGQRPRSARTGWPLSLSERDRESGKPEPRLSAVADDRDGQRQTANRAEAAAAMTAPMITMDVTPDVMPITVSPMPMTPPTKGGMRKLVVLCMLSVPQGHTSGGLRRDAAVRGRRGPWSLRLSSRNRYSEVR